MQLKGKTKATKPSFCHMSIYFVISVNCAKMNTSVVTIIRTGQQYFS
uniref:Uncharacterized protein n=1 Tax=Arundo donax TaxID=35708 RepID=A0A0A8ZPL3_ARUDO